MQELTSLISERFGVDAEPDTPLADAGLTSLDLVELAVRIEEHFGMRIDASLYPLNPTPRQLAKLIEEHQ